MEYDLNTEYGDKIRYEEHNGKHSLLMAQRGKDGDTYVTWGRKSFGKDKLSNVSFPWGIKCDSKEQLIEALAWFIKELTDPKTPPMDDDIQW